MNFRDLVTIAEVRAATGWTIADYTDPQVQTMITDVSMLIESLVGHGFPHYEATGFTFLGRGTDTIELYGFIPLAGVPTSVAGVTFDSEAYDLYPVDGPPYDELISRGLVFGENERNIIVADWGWEDVPADVKAVAIRLIKRYAADDAWAASVSGTSAITRDIQKVDIGEGRASVTFGEKSASSASFRSTGDPVADRLIKRYRRIDLGVTI